MINIDQWPLPLDLLGSLGVRQLIVSDTARRVYVCACLTACAPMDAAPRRQPGSNWEQQPRRVPARERRSYLAAVAAPTNGQY